MSGNTDNNTTPVQGTSRIIPVVVSLIGILFCSFFVVKAFDRSRSNRVVTQSPTKSTEVRMANDAGMASDTAGKSAVVFAGGCFWCTEAAFEQLEGVSDVESGYAGGEAETANYEAVCTGLTGHAEVIRIFYDPAKISYDQLLDVFFDAHDPTTLNRQGHDVGTQYRSAIFFANETERQAAAAKIEHLNSEKKFTKPIVTTLEPLTRFYAAEGYHQGFAGNNPLHPYIRSTSEPKVCKVRDKHAELIRKK